MVQLSAETDPFTKHDKIPRTPMKLEEAEKPSQGQGVAEEQKQLKEHLSLLKSK